MSPPPIARISLVSLLATLFGACASAGGAPDNDGARTTTSITASAASAGAAVPEVGLRGEPPGGSPRRGDPKWQRALAALGSEGDPMDLTALAEAEGATGLLEGVEDGGDLFAAACAALPFADDAELALGRLAQIARLPDPAIAGGALTAIHKIFAKPPRQREPLDLEGSREAVVALTFLARPETPLPDLGLRSPSAPPPQTPRDVRAKAISALRAAAEHGLLDAASIPTDLDPAE